MAASGRKFLRKASHMRLLSNRWFAALAFCIVLCSSMPAWAKPKKSKSVPEIDPAGASAVAALLIGGLALVRGRQGRRR